MRLINSSAVRTKFCLQYRFLKNDTRKSLQCSNYAERKMIHTKLPYQGSEQSMPTVITMKPQ